MRASPVLLLFALSACGGESEREGAGGEPSRETAMAPTPDRLPAEPPAVRVRAERERGSREVAAHIENNGRETVQLSSTYRLERRLAGEWRTVEGVELVARDRCGEPTSACVTLVPGGVLIPPPWLGTLGDAQCACEECTAAPGGQYRFSVRGCEGGPYAPGEPFTLPGEDGP